MLARGVDPGIQSSPLELLIHLGTRGDQLYPHEAPPPSISLHLRDSNVRIDNQHWFTLDLRDGTTACETRGIWAGFPDGSDDMRPPGLALFEFDRESSSYRLICVAAAHEGRRRRSLILFPAPGRWSSAPVVVEAED